MKQPMLAQSNSINESYWFFDLLFSTFWVYIMNSTVCIFMHRLRPTMERGRKGCITMTVYVLKAKLQNECVYLRVQI